MPTWSMLLLAWACGGGDPSDTAGEGDGGAAAGWCDTAVEVGWDDFGHGFVLTHCQGCHASTSPERHGAPESVVFDTEQDVLDQAEAVLRVVVDSPTMPPAGGVTDGEKELLRTWLICSD